MDFSPNPSEKALQTELAKKMENAINPLVASRDENGLFTGEEWRALGDAGVFGLPVPTELGGSGLGATGTALAFETLGSGCDDMGLLFAAGAHLFACVMPVVEMGGDALKNRYLSGMVSGDLAGANAASEENAGSDLFSMETVFEKQGDHYLLNGRKSYVANATNADLFVVYAGTKQGPGFFGTSAFIVDRETPGLTVEDPFAMIGLRSMQACEIVLENCRVSASDLLGSEGQGGLIFNRCMQWERLGLYAAYAGAMERDLARVIGHARKRKQFGQKISRQQAVSHRIVDMKLRLESAKLLLYKACCLFDQGQDVLLDSSLAKIAITEAAIRSGVDSLSIFAGEGYKAEAGISHSLEDALAALSASGTPDLMREIVAAELRL